MDFSRMSDGIRLHLASHRHDGYDGDDEAGPAPSAPFLTDAVGGGALVHGPRPFAGQFADSERTPRARTPSTMTPTQFNPNIPRRWATRAATWQPRCGGPGCFVQHARFRRITSRDGHCCGRERSQHGRKRRRWLLLRKHHSRVPVDLSTDQHLGELGIRLGRPGQPVQQFECRSIRFSDGRRRRPWRQ